MINALNPRRCAIGFGRDHGLNQFDAGVTANLWRTCCVRALTASRRCCGNGRTTPFQLESRCQSFRCSQPERISHLCSSPHDYIFFQCVKV
jgi:hypothetical protein